MVLAIELVREQHTREIHVREVSAEKGAEPILGEAFDPFVARAGVGDRVATVGGLWLLMTVATHRDRRRRRTSSGSRRVVGNRRAHRSRSRDGRHPRNRRLVRAVAVAFNFNS
jgi:hypothetical protein